MANVGHLIVVRTDKGVGHIIARNEEAIARGIRHREARGEIIEKIGCAAQCPCDGAYEAGNADFYGKAV